jgi:aminopeptidase N
MVRVSLIEVTEESNQRSSSYDEPAIRAAFSIRVRHDVRYISASNTAQESKTPENETSYVVSKFYDVPPIQTYLIAFVISTLGFVSDNTNPVALRVFAKPQSVSEGEADFALSVSWPILLGFEQYLYIPYAFSKMDQFAFPEFVSGAMENWVRSRISSLFSF